MEGESCEGGGGGEGEDGGAQTSRAETSIYSARKDWLVDTRGVLVSKTVDVRAEHNTVLIYRVNNYTD